MLRRFVTFLVLGTLLVVVGTAGSIWWTARQDARPKSDAIVVLGAAQFDGRPSSVFKARLQHARKLYEADVAPRVTTAGGGSPGAGPPRAGAKARAPPPRKAYGARRAPRVIPVGGGQPGDRTTEAEAGAAFLRE